MGRSKRLSLNPDWPLTLTVLALCAVGLGALYSAGYSEKLGYSAQMKRQAMSMGVGFVCFLVCMLVRPELWKRNAYLVYLLGCGLLTAILFSGVVAGGARRWLEIGGFRMQPSEFMKVALIIALARLFSHSSSLERGYNILSLLKPCMLMGIPFVLIVVEPDLGTGLCHLLIGGTMLMLAGVKKRTVLTLGLLGMCLAVPAWFFGLKEYQKQRILTFMSPEDDPLGSGYHAIQSKIAVGSGSLTGKGFLQGTQTQLRFLPEQTTDFIFSVLAEEWGFVGSLIVVSLYGFLIFRLLTIAARCNEIFPAFVVIGVAAMIFWHVLVNVGMVVGVLPVVGLTLPLLSFGGSSVVAVLGALGLAAGISSRRFLFN